MTAHRMFATFAMLAMLGTAHATRVLEQPERSFELTLSQLTLPANASGGLTVKACEACPYNTHVLTAGTKYFINNQIMTFDDFSRVARDIRANQRSLQTAVAGVFIDVGTGRVTRVTLVYAGQ